MALPTMAEITNLYLYKQNSIPSEDGRINSQLITATPKPIKVDRNEFMSKETGPERFITAADFSFVKMFFEAANYWRAENDNPLANLKNGTRYSKKEILTILGYYNTEGKAIGKAFETQTLGFLDDGKDDLLERAYIWNTTSFMVSDDAVFVIDQNGNRYIENFAIEPRKDEDFDFDGGFYSNLVNGYLERNIDPSGIGKKVTIEFVGELEHISKFSYQDYFAERNRKSHFSPINAAETYIRARFGELNYTIG